MLQRSDGPAQHPLQFQELRRSPDIVPVPLRHYPLKRDIAFHAPIYPAGLSEWSLISHSSSGPHTRNMSLSGRISNPRIRPARPFRATIGSSASTLSDRATTIRSKPHGLPRSERPAWKCRSGSCPGLWHWQTSSHSPGELRRTLVHRQPLVA